MDSYRYDEKTAFRRSIGASRFKRLSKRASPEMSLRTELSHCLAKA